MNPRIEEKQQDAAQVGNTLTIQTRGRVKQLETKDLN